MSSQSLGRTGLARSLWTIPGARCRLRHYSVTLSASLYPASLNERTSKGLATAAVEGSALGQCLPSQLGIGPEDLDLGPTMVSQLKPGIPLLLVRYLHLGALGTPRRVAAWHRSAAGGTSSYRFGLGRLDIVSHEIHNDGRC